LYRIVNHLRMRAVESRSMLIQDVFANANQAVYCFRSLPAPQREYLAFATRRRAVLSILETGSAVAKHVVTAQYMHHWCFQGMTGAPCLGPKVLDRAGEYDIRVDSLQLFFNQPISPGVNVIQHMPGYFPCT